MTRVSPAGYLTVMSENAPEETTGDVQDDALPDDVRPGEDNPLAAGLDDAETAGDLSPGELLEEGKTPDQWEDGERPGSAEHSAGDPSEEQTATE